MKKSKLHGFRIYKQEPLPETFKRVINEQLQLSLLLCKQFPETPEYSTHEIRKSTKRIRAIYRLFQQVTGSEIYFHAREFYSNLNHVLAEHRLSQVYCDTLKVISADRGMPVNQGYIGKLTRDLEKRHKELTVKIMDAHQVERYLYDMISAEVSSNSEAPLLACNFHDLTPGLRKTYSRCRKCLDLVVHQPATENFHELRKMVKSLWNQLILIRPIWPAYYGFLVHNLDVLAQRLGFEHDLAELEKRLVGGRSGKYQKHRISLAEFIAKKRLRVQKSILPLAQRLFVDKPGLVEMKMEIYYRMFVR